MINHTVDNTRDDDLTRCTDFLHKLDRFIRKPFGLTKL